MTYMEAGILEEYQRLGIGNYRGNVASEIIIAVEKYIARLSKMKKTGLGLYFLGPNGTGKTGLMCEVLKGVCDKGYTAIFSTLSGLADKFAEGWKSDKAKKEFVTFVRSIDFLGIDDIGKEYRGKTEFIITVFDRVLRYRSMRCRPTLITSNIGPEKIRLVYGDSIASLLYGKFLPLRLIGEDFRKALQTELQGELFGENNETT